MKCVSRTALCLVVTVAVFGLVAPAAQALAERGKLGDLAFTVYAPDWTWQKRNVNFLYVLENQAAMPAEVTVALEFPPGKESHFKVASGELHKAARPEDERSVLTLSVEVPARGTRRCAMTDILAVDGVPRQVYGFDIVFRCGEDEARVAYLLRTVRGAAVSSAKSALYIPVVVALAWSVLFAVALARFAARKAWRTPNEPIAASLDREPWIDQRPI